MQPERQLLSGVFPPPQDVTILREDAIAKPDNLRLADRTSNRNRSFITGYSLIKKAPEISTKSTGIPITFAEGENHPDLQGYRISIKQDGIEIEAESSAGFQYAGTTLAQLFATADARLPEMIISDEPAFPNRGFMLDISRNKVPTMDTLFALVDLLALRKYNHLQLYTEHTFAYRAHETVWRDASPMTADEIKQLDRYCRQRHIELAANQNSFGHLQQWLKHPDYRQFAECTGEFVTPWGETRKGPFSLNPIDPLCLEFLAGLYDELLPCFSSPLINVGCDETFDLGQGASRDACTSKGKGRVYLDFLLKIRDLVVSRGKTMMFWGDIILNHPELISEIPRDMIALVWGYEADHPFEEQCRLFSESGSPFWVCPGTSNWNSITGRLQNALENMDAAAKAGRSHGASGIIITEWGDNGHWQTMPFTQLMVSAGGYAGWHGCAPTTEILGDAVDHSTIIMKLGRMYKLAEFNLHNTSPLFPLIRFSNIEKILNQWTMHALLKAESEIEPIREHILSLKPVETETCLRVDELRLGTDMLLHAVHRGLWKKAGQPSQESAELLREIENIESEFKRLWLARNRVGGMAESMEPLAMRRREYQPA